MKTTINADTLLLDKLNKSMAEVGLPKDKMIELLISRIIKNNSFVPQPGKKVKYQDGGSERVWKIEHINLEPEFYEKVLDFRRHFKFFVSWFIAYAIIHYLDELVSDLINNNEDYTDNYMRDYAYISEMLGNIRIFLTMMDTKSKKT